jgi:hypothetical protein
VWAAAATPKMRVPSSPSSAPSSTLLNLQIGLRTVPSDGYGRPIGRSCDGNGTPVYRPSSEGLKSSTATDGCKDSRPTVDGVERTLKYFKPLYIYIYYTH